MKRLFLLFERTRPPFEKGGRLARLRPVHEAMESFLFPSGARTPGPPHVRDAIDSKRYMISVFVALLPALGFGLWNAGHMANAAAGVAAGPAGERFGLDLLAGARLALPLVLVSYAVGGFWEALFACVRRHEINEGFLVTGLLFPLTLPPATPLWQVAAGITFGVVIGKEIFGGVGYNVLNPALTARAFLFFAYPSSLSGDGVWIAGIRESAVEGISGATPLAVAAATPAGDRAAEALARAGFTFRSMALGVEGGSLGETSAIPILLGAAVLLLGGVGAWRILAGGALGLAAAAALCNACAGSGANPMLGLPVGYHFVMGGSLFGIVFMATDPVSAAATGPGKWVYGFLIGALIVLIRAVNPAFPEGVMLSILFLNVMAPLIDYLVIRAHMASRDRHLRRFRRA